jgi:DNA-binding response OmpR family regulator
MIKSRRKTILLIEDNAAIIDALGFLLEEEGYHVTLPERGVALQSLKAPFPDLILLDLLLSGMDGKVICQQLKAQETTCHIPIILMSANKNTPRIAREVGADDWIMKPFEMWALLALLDAYMGRDSNILAK